VTIETRPDGTRGQRFILLGTGYMLFTFDPRRVHRGRVVSDEPPFKETPEDAHPIEKQFPRQPGPGRITIREEEAWTMDVFSQWAKAGIGASVKLPHRKSMGERVMSIIENEWPCVLKVIMPPRPHKFRIISYKDPLIVDINFDNREFTFLYREGAKLTLGG
jgi:hypothetical protein